MNDNRSSYITFDWIRWYGISWIFFIYCEKYKSDRYYSWIDCPNLYSIELGNDTFSRSSFELRSITVMVIISIDLPNIYSIILGENCFYSSSCELKGIISNDVVSARSS